MVAMDSKIAVPDLAGPVMPSAELSIESASFSISQNQASRWSPVSSRWSMNVARGG